MKFMMSTLGFLVLVAVAFYLGYKSEITSDAGANPSDYGIGSAKDEAVSGGVHFGTKSSNNGRIR